MLRTLILGLAALAVAEDMSAAEQRAAATLGWDEASWTAGDTGPLANQWHLLTHGEQSAALRMGYSAGDFGPG